jgi:hypothetical protein
MPVFLSTATLGNADSLWTLGHSGEVMAAFCPHKDDPQHVHECLPALYIYDQNRLLWLWSDEFAREQAYLPQSNVLQTRLFHHALQLEVTLTDLVPSGATALARRVEVANKSSRSLRVGFFLYGDWNMGGQRMGNSLRFDRDHHAIVQNHREAALGVSGSGVEMWSLGKAGENWGSNAKKDLDDGFLHNNDLEIGDVCWATGFQNELAPGATQAKYLSSRLRPTDVQALEMGKKINAQGFESLIEEARAQDTKYLQAGVQVLEGIAGSKELPGDLRAAFERSLLCLPLLQGREGRGCGGSRVRLRVHLVRWLRLLLAARRRRVRLVAFWTPAIPSTARRCSIGARSTRTPAACGISATSSTARPAPTGVCRPSICRSIKSEPWLDSGQVPQILASARRKAKRF